MAKADTNNVTTKGSEVQSNVMDYPEHEKTYELFLLVAKWTIAFCVALLVGMMVMFPMELGFVAGLLTFLILIIASYFLLQN